MRRELLEERKQTVYELICDEFVCTNEGKRDRQFLMNVPKAQRHELQEVLDALVAEGKIEVFIERKIYEGNKSESYRCLYRSCPWLWICHHRG